MTVSSSNSACVALLHENLRVPERIAHWLSILNPHGQSLTLAMDKRIATVIACQELLVDVGDLSLKERIRENVVAIKRYHFKKCEIARRGLPMQIFYLERFKEKSLDLYKNCEKAENVLHRKIALTASGLLQNQQNLANVHAILGDEHIAGPNREAAAQQLEERSNQITVLKSQEAALKFHLEKILKNKKTILVAYENVAKVVNSASLKLQVLEKYEI